MTTKKINRAERRRAERAIVATAKTPRWKSPMVILTAFSIMVAIVLVGAVIVVNQPRHSTTGSIHTPLISTPVTTANGMDLGSTSAPVTVDIWGDFQCPACDSFSKNTLIPLVTKYTPTGQVLFREHDFAFIGLQSEDAATAATCAADQNKYWPFHDYLFENQGQENGGWATRSLFDAISTQVGLDPVAFAACLSDGKARAKVIATGKEAQTLALSSTPTIVVNGKIYPGTVIPTADQLSAEIDAALASPKPSAVTPQ